MQVPYLSSSEIREQLLQRGRHNITGGTTAFGATPSLHSSSRIASVATRAAGAPPAVVAGGGAGAGGAQRMSTAYIRALWAGVLPPISGAGGAGGTTSTGSGGTTSTGSGSTGGGNTGSGNTGGGNTGGGNTGAAYVPLPPPSPLASTIDGWTPDMPFRIDLSSIADKPFVLDENDYVALCKPLSIYDIAQWNAAGNIFSRMPVWNNVNDENIIFEGFTKRLERTTFLGAGTYGTVFEALLDGRPCVVKMTRIEVEDHKKYMYSIDELRETKLSNFVNAINEIIIHFALMDMCKSDPVIRQKQSEDKMARIPEIYGFFYVQGKSFVKGSQNGDTTSDVTRYVVTIMEKINMTLERYLTMEDTFLRNIGSTPPPWTAEKVHKMTAISTVSFYQLAALSERLGQLLHFNHRDLKLNNVMVELLPKPNKGGPRTICGGAERIQTYMIDFGCSMATYRGKLFACNQGLFDNGPIFNPGHDITFVAWSFRKAVGCSVNTSRTCRANYLELFDDVIKTILNASGINFSSDAHEYTYGLTWQFYTALASVGDESMLRQVSDPTYPNSFFKAGTIHMDLIRPHGVKLMLKHVVRVLGQMCNPGPDRDRIIAEETQKARALMSLVTSAFAEDDDEPIVEDVSDP
jgi:hypothetical protein